MPNGAFRQVREREHAEVFLRKLKTSDKDKICQWICSPALIYYSFVVNGPHSTREFNTQAQAERYFNLLLSDPERQAFAIMYNNIIIGVAGIKDIIAHQADCFIDIGEECYRGRGIGFLAMTQLLDRAFYLLAFSQISLDVLEFNQRALKLYENLGFVAQDYCTWHYDEFGIYWRVIRMSLTKQQWLSRSIRHVD